jgi:hypothetical protein
MNSVGVTEAKRDTKTEQILLADRDPHCEVSY